jgi:exosortase
LLALTPSWCAIAWVVSKAQWFWNHRPDLQFGWIVLILCGYLFWEAWEQRPPLRLKLGPLAILSGLAGLALLLLIQIYQAAFGTNAPSVFGTALSCLLIVAANLNYVFGTAGLRQFGFAFGFLLIAMPLPGMIHQPIVLNLQNLVAAMDVELLNLIGIPAQRVGSLIYLPNGAVGIDEACSGIRSLQSTIMATLFIGYLSLSRTWLRVGLFCSGIALAVLGNLGRSFFLSYTAYSKGIPAIDAYHDSAGWSILTFTGVGVVLLAWFFARVERKLVLRREPLPAAAAPDIRPPSGSAPSPSDA